MAREANQSLKGSVGWVDVARMSTVQEIESAIVRLSPQERERVRDWLNDMAEEQAEVAPAFKDKVLRAQSELSQGKNSRVRTP